MLIWAFLLLDSLPLLYLFALTVAPLVRCPRGPAKAAKIHRIAIVIPAHDEDRWIAETVRHARDQHYPKEAFGVWVVADNCRDKTADEARGAGASVLERQGNPGKGQALHDLFQHLLFQDWEAFLVLDADSRLHPDTLSVLNDYLAADSDVVAVRYGVFNPEASWRTRMMELSTASYNGLRPLGRVALGLSAGLAGNGFCLTRRTVMEVPYLAHSIVEDLEYHLVLLRSGRQVDFCSHVWVKARMPTTQRAARIQRVRWERGRWLMIKTHAPRLLADLMRGHLRAFDGLTDVLMPPMSVVLLGLLPALVAGSGLQQILALGGVGIVAGHYLVAAWLYGSLSALPWLAIYMPWYVVEKSWMMVHSFVTERHVPWIRTERD